MLKVCYILYSSYKDYMHILMIYLSIGFPEGNPRWLLPSCECGFVPHNPPPDVIAY